MAPPWHRQYQCPYKPPLPILTDKNAKKKPMGHSKHVNNTYSNVFKDQAHLPRSPHLSHSSHLHDSSPLVLLEDSLLLAAHGKPRRGF